MTKNEITTKTLAEMKQDCEDIGGSERDPKEEFDLRKACDRYAKGATPGR